MTIQLKGGHSAEDPRLGRVPQFDAWFAGLFEGEGTIGLCRDSKVSCTLRIGMTDEDVIRRCAEVAGVGQVRGPYQKPGNRQPIWVWDCCKQADVLQVLLRIRPFLGQRRGAAADLAIARLQLGDGRRKPFIHGTTAGYRRHHDYGERPCEPCLAAWRERRRAA